MVTPQQKIQMFEMRLSGASYDDIGKRFGISRQGAHQLLKDTLTQNCSRKRKTAFPGIDQYLYESGSTLKALYDAADVPESYSVFQRKLTGRARLHLEDIRAVLRVTSLTFEKAFGMAESAVDEAANAD